MGTNGSGKTTLVSRLLDEFKINEVIDLNIRKLPVGHVMKMKKGRVFVPGYYHDVVVGGCDTIPAVMKPRDEFFSSRLPTWAAEYRHVLYEGVIFGDEVTRTVELSKKLPCVIVYLTTPVDDCVKAVINRRAAKGNDEPFNQKQTRDRHRQMQNVAQRLRDAGMTVKKLNREAAYQYIREELSK